MGIKRKRRIFGEFFAWGEILGFGVVWVVGLVVGEPFFEFGGSAFADCDFLWNRYF